jgi:hypothetical protein
MSQQIGFRLPSELIEALKARLQALKFTQSEYFIWLARQDLGDRTQKPKLIDRIIALENRVAELEEKLND